MAFNKKVNIVLLLVALVGLFFLLKGTPFLASVVTTCENTEPNSVSDLLSLGNLTTESQKVLSHNVSLTEKSLDVPDVGIISFMESSCSSVLFREDIKEQSCLSSDGSWKIEKTGEEFFGSCSCPTEKLLSSDSCVTSDETSCTSIGGSWDGTACTGPAVVPTKLAICNDLLDVRCGYSEITMDMDIDIKIPQKDFIRINDDYYWCSEDNNIIYRAPDLLTASNYVNSFLVCTQTAGPSYVTNLSYCEDNFGTIEDGFCECVDGSLLEQSKTCTHYITDEDICTSLRGNITDNICVCANSVKLIAGNTCPPANVSTTTSGSSSSSSTTSTTATTTSAARPTTTTTTTQQPKGISTTLIIFIVIGALLLFGRKKNG